MPTYISLGVNLSQKLFVGINITAIQQAYPIYLPMGQISIPAKFHCVF